MRGAFLGAFASTAPAHAWQGNAAGPEQASQAARTASGGIADIVVTARRRSESLQNTPVAVSAITGATLADRGATDISAVAQAEIGRAPVQTTVTNAHPVCRLLLD